MAKGHYQDPPTEQEKKAFDKFSAEDEELVLVTGFGAAYLRNRFTISLAFPGGILIIVGLIWAYFTQNNLGYGALFGLIGAAIYSFFRVKYISAANKYILTTRRLIIKRGILSAKLTSAMYDKITHLDVDQGFVDKFLLRHGNIVVNTAGVNKDEIVLKFVDHPIELKNLIERLINREREQSGVRVGRVETIEGELVD